MCMYTPEDMRGSETKGYLAHCVYYYGAKDSQKTTGVSDLDLVQPSYGSSRPSVETCLIHHKCLNRSPKTSPSLFLSRLLTLNS